MNKVDISNLRFYAEMAREFKWATDVIHPNVIATTLKEIADRFEAENQRLNTDVETLQRTNEWLPDIKAREGLLQINKQLREELQQEKERADSNFASCERIKAKLSNAANELKSAKAEREARSS